MSIISDHLTENNEGLYSPTKEELMAQEILRLKTTIKKLRALLKKKGAIKH